MKRFFLIAICTLTAVILLRDGDLNDTPHSTPKQEPSALTLRPTSVDFQKPKEKLAIPRAKPVPHTEPKSIVEDFKESFKTLTEKANQIDGQTRREQMFEEWVHNSDKIEHLRYALLWPEDFGQEFGKHYQAEARYFAIQTMRTESRLNGTTQNVQRLISDMVRDHERQIDIANSKGRLADFADLVAIVSESLREEEQDLAFKLVEVLQGIGYSNLQNKKLREVVDDELFMALYPKLGKKNAAQLIDRAYRQI